MSNLVGNTEDRFSHVAAHMVVVNCFLKIRSTVNPKVFSLIRMP